ncbi:MAG: nucleotidyltransferase [Sphaerochaetaceae bacterium]|nr:nucleotidyltransferase [Sphaerochaetaceae bacterium]
MSVQSQFLKFNKNIQLDYNLNSELKEKRDILVNILKGSDDLPAFKIINQGSYGMHLGVEPLDKEYDIDVGLRFNVNKADYSPMDFKNIIYDLLKNHTDYGAKIKNPCVTITYKKEGEKAYHIDLVSYVYEDKNSQNSQIYLARGKQSDEDSIQWERSDPVGLVKYINEIIERGNSREQARRVVRYIKRWKNKNFSNIRNAEPASIGITLIVFENFTYYECNDLEALLNSLNEINRYFYYSGTSFYGRELYKIEYTLPFDLNFEYGKNIFEKMTDKQMTDFKEKLNKFYDDLVSVKEEYDELEKYKKLNKIFGDDFEIPNVENVAKKQTNFIPHTSASGKENFVDR